MKHPSLHPLRWHLASLALCLLCCGLMLHQAWKHYTSSETLASRAEQHARNASSAARQLASDETDIRRHIDDFLKLKKQGVFRTGSPVERPGLFRDLRHDLRIDSMDYEFSEPLHSSIGEFPANAGGFKFHARLLELRMSLLHEEDLMRALALLSQRAPALVRLRECQISQAPDAAGVRASVLAKCRLEWITFSKAKEG